ncbi:probable 50S ribosomal protein L21 [Coccomyxa sp. Obi]|nr:probable 50S ribosomal protein L21 [Coccomyxa sp. Obi]
MELGPTQFKVSPGDVVVTEKIRGVDVNDKVKLDRVLMLGSRDETIIGRPLVPQATVSAVVEEQFQDAKVLIFKKRRRKNSRSLKGHRQDLTTLRIVEIIGIDEHPDNASAVDHREIKEEAA